MNPNLFSSGDPEIVLCHFEMSVKNELKYDYLSYVGGLESAIGIYLRREVLERESPADTSLRKRLYDQTIADQSSDGS